MSNRSASCQTLFGTSVNIDVTWGWRQAKVRISSDEAMHRRYNRWHSHFDQPDRRNNVRTKGGAPPIGFIIYGLGKYTPYNENGVLFDVNARSANGVETNDMTRCL
jgi:hypothetical protein